MKHVLHLNGVSLTGHHRSQKQSFKQHKKKHSGRVRAASARAHIPLCLLINPETEREPEADRKSTF